MNKYILSIMLSALCYFSQAQRTISIEEASEYIRAEDGLPEDVTYVKDINNRLDQYVGIWKCTFEGRSYEFHFTKKIAYDYGPIKWDNIIGRILIKNADGSVWYNSLNRPDDSTRFGGGYLQKNTIYVMSFTGNCYNDAGSVYLYSMNADKTGMKLSYWVEPDIQSNDCPPNAESVLPMEPKVLLLTKETPNTMAKQPTNKTTLQSKKLKK